MPDALHVTGLGARVLVQHGLLSGERTQCLSGEFVMVRPKQTLSATESAPMVTAPPSMRPEETTDGSRLAQAMVAEIVFPGHVNHRGVLHGGPAMSWMSKAGFVAATRQSRKTVVMAGCEKLDFEAPARVGDIVEVHARVTSLGHRSIRVQADMWAETAETGDRHWCTSAVMTYVALPVGSQEHG